MEIVEQQKNEWARGDFVFTNWYIYLTRTRHLDLSIKVAFNRLTCLTGQRVDGMGQVLGKFHNGYGFIWWNPPEIGHVLIIVITTWDVPSFQQSHHISSYGDTADWLKYMLYVHQEEDSFFVWCLVIIIMLRRGSIILISRGLRGGSYFKSE